MGGFTSSAPQLQARGILERGNEGREGVFQCGWAELLCGAAATAFIVFCIWPSYASMFFWSHLTERSGALAAWVGAVGTVALAFGLLQTWIVMSRSARSASFELMNKRFNAPEMLYVSAKFARNYLDRKDKGEFWKNNTLPAWNLVHFLNQVGYLACKNRIDFTDAALAFGDHIIRIGDRRNEALALNANEKRYSPFFRLHKRVKESDIPRIFLTELDGHYDDEFWRCEASLDAHAKIEG